MIIFLLLLLNISLFSQSNDSKTKSIYVTSVNASEMDKNLVSKAQSLINIELLNKSEKKLKIYDDEMAFQLKKKLAQAQKMGCNETTCLQMIAESLDTDYILQSKMYQESGNKINLTLKKSLFDKDNASMILEIEVTKSFYIPQMEFYISELIQKILKKEYSINDKNAPQVFDEGINIGSTNKVEIKPLSTVKTESFQDERINEIINILKLSERKAIKYYNNNEYLKAIEEYNRIILTLNTKIADEDKKLLENYLNSLIKNKNLAIQNHAMNQLEKVDTELKKDKNLVGSTYESYINRYEGIYREFNTLADANTNKEIILVLNDRLEKLRMSYFRWREIQINEIYNKFLFQEAYNQYESLYNEVQKYDFKEDKNYKKELLNKIKITKETGTNNLFNRVRNYCDNAIKINLKMSLNIQQDEIKPEELKKAIDSSMMDAKSLMNSNSIFLDNRIQKYYDSTYKTIYGKSESDVRREEDIRRQNEVNRLRMEEREQRKVFRNIDILYPGLGGTFEGSGSGFVKLSFFSMFLGGAVNAYNQYNSKYAEYNTSNNLYFALALTSSNSFLISIYADNELRSKRKDLSSLSSTYSALSFITIGWYFLNMGGDSNENSRYGFQLDHSREPILLGREAVFDDIYKMSYNIGF